MPSSRAMQTKCPDGKADCSHAKKRGLTFREIPNQSNSAKIPARKQRFSLFASSRPPPWHSQLAHRRSASSAAVSSAVSGSSSTFRPRETSLWMRSAKPAGSSMVKPETRREVSKRSWVMDLTVRSFSPSASTFFLSSLMIGDSG